MRTPSPWWPESPKGLLGWITPPCLCLIHGSKGELQRCWKVMTSSCLFFSCNAHLFLSPPHWVYLFFFLSVPLIIIPTFLSLALSPTLSLFLPPHFQTCLCISKVPAEASFAVAFASFLTDLKEMPMFWTSPTKRNCQSKTSCPEIRHHCRPTTFTYPAPK